MSWAMSWAAKTDSVVSGGGYDYLVSLGAAQLKPKQAVAVNLLTNMLTRQKLVKTPPWSGLPFPHWNLEQHR